jgi:hypothetical protein
MMGIATGVAMGMLVWPFLSMNFGMAIPGLLGVGGAVAAMLLLPRRAVVYCAAMIVGVTILISVPRFDGSFAWAKISAYGARKYPTMATAGTMNLCALLETHFGWHNELAPVSIPLPFVDGGDYRVPLKSLLSTIYALAMVPCGIGAAVYFRRNDPRVLIAIVAPWVLFFALLPQLHSRYLIWGASFSCLFLALDWGMILLCGVLTWLSWSMIAFFLLRQDASYWPAALKLVRGMNDDVAWMVLAIAAVLVYCSIPPIRTQTD